MSRVSRGIFCGFLRSQFLIYAQVIFIKENKMAFRKTYAVLSLAFAFGLAACGDASSTSPKNDRVSTTTINEMISAKEANLDTLVDEDESIVDEEVIISNEDRTRMLEEWKIIRDDLINFYETNGICNKGKEGATMTLRLDGKNFKMTCMRDDWNEYNWLNEDYDDFIWFFFNKMDSIVGNSETYFYEIATAINNVTGGNYRKTMKNLSRTDDCNFKIDDDIWEYAMDEYEVGQNIKRSNRLVFDVYNYTNTITDTYVGTTFLEECNAPKKNIRRLNEGKTTITTECTDSELIIEEVKIGRIITQEERNALFESFMKKCKIEMEMLY